MGWWMMSLTTPAARDRAPSSMFLNSMIFLTRPTVASYTRCHSDLFASRNSSSRADMRS